MEQIFIAEGHNLESALFLRFFFLRKNIEVEVGMLLMIWKLLRNQSFAHIPLQYLKIVLGSRHCLVDKRQRIKANTTKSVHTRFSCNATADNLLALKGQCHAGRCARYQESVGSEYYIFTMSL